MQNLFPYYFQAKIILSVNCFSKSFLASNINNSKYYIMEKYCQLNGLEENIKNVIYKQIYLCNYLQGLGVVKTIIDIFHFNQHLYIIKEFKNEYTFDNFIFKLNRNSQKLSIRNSKYLAWTIAQGMAEIHKKCIVLRKINPKNIFFEINSKNEILRCQINGFDFADNLKFFGFEFLTICGTTSYIAPEFLSLAYSHVNGERNEVRLTNKVDVYSYGLILIFMIYGKDAISFQPNRERFSRGEIYLPENNDITKKLMNLIKSCIIVNPYERISFSDILKCPFFNSLEIPRFPIQFHNNMNIFLYNSKYVATFTDAYRKVFMKIYKSDICEEKEQRKQILGEINSLWNMRFSNNVVKSLEYGLLNNEIALLFEYFNGITLKELFLQRKFSKANKNMDQYFTDDEIKYVARRLMEFIDDMKEINAYHHFLNPTHVLINTDSEGNIKDAKVCGFKYSQSLFMKSKCNYLFEDEYKYFIDPEASTNEYSLESDLWSVGLILYFMAFHQLPSYNLKLLKNYKKIGNIPIPRNRSKDIQNIIQFCLRRRPIGFNSQISLSEELNF